MSPSTKNLRERIEEALDQAEKACASRNCVSSEGDPHQWCNQQKNAVSALLSSELSLAVKGLRESVCGLDASRMTAEELNDHLDNCICPPDLPASRHELLRRFNAKAKKILGESS